MLTIQVNGRPVEAKSGEMLLHALRRAQIHVPTLCYLEDVFPSGACRMCVVEVAGRPNLVPSCACPVTEGMQVQTHSSRVVRARKMIIELLLANHPDDCLYCVKSADCELRRLASELGVRQRRMTGTKRSFREDTSSPSIERDPEKCILCGKCVRVCEEVQGVAAIDFIGRGSNTCIATAFEQGLNVSSCVYCGQCIMACPTGAIREQSHMKEVTNALADRNRVVVLQHAPSVSVSLGEEFGIKIGADVAGKMTAAARRLGFDYVFDTSFSADLTIMEEVSELIYRVQNGGKLPLLTSCCPAWVKHVEQSHPDFLENVSTCKSPQQMLGAITKSYFAEKKGIDPERIFSVAVMPCTAKKFEMERPEMVHDTYPDVDAVLTTREFARMIRLRHLDLDGLEPEAPDTPFGDRSTAGKIFGASGGVMEAAARTAHYMLTGHDMKDLRVNAVRGLKGVKEARLQIGKLDLGIAVVSGLGNAAPLLDQIRNGRDDLHFIEVMTCPGGCINGGGQPFALDEEAVRKRMQALYKIDREEPVRTAHGNPAIRYLYQDFLGEPLGHKSHELLHTCYSRREVVA
jgi:NADH-quinone oxidoreductase subunit G/NADP-reducing hydrogenase subunit HndD